MASATTSVAAVLSTLSGSDFLSSADASAEQTAALLELASQLKSGDRRIRSGQPGAGPDLHQGVHPHAGEFPGGDGPVGRPDRGSQSPGHPAGTPPKGEPLEDTARVLSRFCDALAVRTFAQQELADYAHWATIPVINALTDLEHPCQALADFLTMQEAFGDLRGQTLTYVGDGNNVAHSLMLCGALLGVNVRIGCPDGFEPLPGVLEQARSLEKLAVRRSPSPAIRWKLPVVPGLYTDVWASMGQEQEQAERERAFQGFCLNEELLAEADSRAIVLHCLPAHRGEEISAGVMEGPASRIFDQAENRLHAQQALLAALLGGL